MSAQTDQAADVQVEMVDIEVNGVPLKAPKGSMIIEATDKAGIEIPRFCYHPKLTIAANCRMCLVDVEKMPKPVPACATPVMDGMKVYTTSRRAMDAQHGVMEFLLINHPLDCPICDQGGECELQDVAMGYGRSVSRFTERKRVVKDKNVGPLVQTEMTRCIHCTRCVRFLEEIAGTTEMGGSGRGDRLEIGTCVENSIDSELSGNIIDLCPVGALTNKPFRFSARAWELMAKPFVGVHDGVGSLLYHHVRRGEILRTVPREHEARNEAWLADRDRYSHSGLQAEERALLPEIKEDGDWKAVSWDEALEHARAAIGQCAADRLGVLMSPSASNEVYFMAQSMVRQLGCQNIDHRLRRQDFRAVEGECPVFGMNIADVGHARSILLVGCNPREEAPIVGHRVRQAWRKGAKVAAINSVDWDFHFDTAPNHVVPPQRMVAELAAVASAAAEAANADIPAGLAAVVDAAEVTDAHRSLAAQLAEHTPSLVMLGATALEHIDAALLQSLARFLAASTGAACNLLTPGCNSVGAATYGAMPGTGMHAGEMLSAPLQTYLLWDVDPGCDLDNPAAAQAALAGADHVIAVTSFASEALREVASVILPLSPLAESEGSILNFDGDETLFAAAAKPRGESRPGWKILRRLGDGLGLSGFDQVRLEQVREAMQPVESAGAATAFEVPAYAGALFRTGSVPMYAVDALCRRSPALQQTTHADKQFVGLNPADAARFGLVDGGKARVRQGDAYTELEVRLTERVPAGAALVHSGLEAVRSLGASCAPIIVEVA